MSDMTPEERRLLIQLEERSVTQQRSFEAIVKDSHDDRERFWTAFDKVNSKADAAHTRLDIAEGQGRVWKYIASGGLLSGIAALIAKLFGGHA